MTDYSLPQLTERFKEIQAEKLNIDMTRGKPSSEQLDLSKDMYCSISNSFSSRNGTDVRNYGGIAGIDEVRELMGSIISVEPENTIVFGNSSLSLMYHYIQANHSEDIFNLRSKGLTPKFLAPSPGYDRHFWICKKMGIELIPIPFNQEGPDMDLIEDYLKKDPDIIGIWCIPKHSNPTGHTYSDAVVHRIAKLKELAKNNFTVMWDNAYAVHDLSSNCPKLSSLREASKQYCTEDSIAIFGSTSKITYAGAGLAAIGLSEKKFKFFCDYLNIQSIGPDKINQLLHARFFSNGRTITTHMEEHAKIVRPKFKIVLDQFANALGDLENVSWSNPTGGYFISLYVVPGTATRVVELSKQLGVALTPAGSAYPNGFDPDNSHIRIAPTCPTVEQLKKASEVITLCVEIAAKEK
jgi:DNA-binding transcriptional MocR family regulator